MKRDEGVSNCGGCSWGRVRILTIMLRVRILTIMLRVRIRVTILRFRIGVRDWMGI